MIACLGSIGAWGDPAKLKNIGLYGGLIVGRFALTAKLMQAHWQVLTDHFGYFAVTFPFIFLLSTAVFAVISTIAARDSSENSKTMTIFGIFSVVALMVLSLTYRIMGWSKYTATIDEAVPIAYIPPY